MQPLEVEDLYKGQKIWVQSGVDDMPCCVTSGHVVSDKGDATHRAVVIEPIFDLGGHGGKVVQIEFTPHINYSNMGFDSVATHWYIEHDYVKHCLLGKAKSKPDTRCNCDIHYLMNVGCPSASGGICPN